MSAMRVTVHGNLERIPISETVNKWLGPLSSSQSTAHLDFSPYLEYYNRQWHMMATDAGGRYTTVKTPDDIINIMGLMLQGDSYESIISSLKTNGAGRGADDMFEYSVNLAVRLLLMLKMGTVKHQISPRRYLVWNSGSLAKFVSHHFEQPQVLDTPHVRLPKSFNAWSIEAIGGLQVEFTDNLADHLLLVDDDTKVLIFHHATFLECQRNSIFPDGLLEETLRSLALLFPESEFRSARNGKEAWFRKTCLRFKPCTVDPRVIKCGNLPAEDRQIEKFSFWRDRLIILKQAYDDATPGSVSQWWHDRRNGERWYTFWVAMLVLAITTTLGVIQCVESGLQVYKAYHPT
ncbi:hypothetical protein F4778DRAFT_75721 [Xylariomycetidae sp. FL2044]|nr:hypothetical protein F4778DRAFT_75721 [Xylariomycetidae sp. FL2044]